MANRLQQFYIFSIDSSFLKNNKYKVNLDMDKARKSDRIISVADSQLFRTIRKVRGVEFSKLELNNLRKRRDKEKKSRTSVDRKENIKAINKRIDEILLVSDLISVSIKHVSQYKYISQNGFYLNGKRYVHFLAGAGHLRRSTVFFITEDIAEKITEILNNGIDLSIPLNYGKFTAYFGLYSSSSKIVTTPRFVVVPDLEIKRMRDVDFVEKDNVTVTQKNIEISHNVFDGMGLISMEFSRKWSEDLELDFDAVQFIIRAPFIKGLLVAFPFHGFAHGYNIKTIKDIYGDVHNIEDVDVILTQSQFKMHSHYKSISQFVENCEINELKWGVTRTNPKKEKEYFWSSYQFLQVLKNDVDIDGLTKETLEYFGDVSGMDAGKTMIYLSGDMAEDDFNQENLSNPLVKVLGMNSNTIHDPHIRAFVQKSLNRKIRDSYAGKLLLHGHYEFLVSDPVALCQHALSINIPLRDLGGLKEGQSYSQYWNDAGVRQVVSGRSPLTWRSELVRLDFTNNRKLQEYYGHLNSGIVISVHGDETMRFADADFDGDAVFTTDNEQMFSYAYDDELPIFYDKSSAPKMMLDLNKIWESNKLSFSSKIGVITNYSSTYYAMQNLFPPDSEEYKTINDRLKICRAAQGGEIDKTKGIEVNKLPDWNKKVFGDPTHNALIVKKRPMWMVYLYHHKKKAWERHYRSYDFYSEIVFNMSLDKLLSLSGHTAEQEKIISKFIRLSPVLIGSESVMERISKFMLSHVLEIKEKIRKDNFDYTIYQYGSSMCDKSDRDRIKKIISQYNKMRENSFLHTNGEMMHDWNSIAEYIKGELFIVCSDLTQLTNTVVDICYHEKKSYHEFVWRMLSDGILYNMSRKYKKYKLPFLKENGSISFMNKRYSLLEVDVAKKEEG